MQRLILCVYQQAKNITKYIRDFLYRAVVFFQPAINEVCRTQSI